MSTKKLLMIGNSFSWNANEYMQRIADSSGADFIVGNLNYGGCSFEMHKDFFENARKVYAFEYTRKETLVDVDVDTALFADDWTHISIQQVSGKAGQFDTYQPYMDYVYDYVRSRVPNAEIIIHQTWAYQKDSEHGDFPRYDRNQEYMFKCIKEAYLKAADVLGVKKIVPSGEAFQLARATEIGDTLCADGFHANVKGKYLAGGAFFETVTGIPIYETTFRPEGITDAEFSILRDCIHNAVTLYNH